MKLQESSQQQKNAKKYLRQIAKSGTITNQALRASNCQDWPTTNTSPQFFHIGIFIFIFFVSLNFPGDLRSLRTPRKEICDAHVEETNNERAREGLATRNGEKAGEKKRRK